MTTRFPSARNLKGKVPRSRDRLKVRAHRTPKIRYRAGAVSLSSWLDAKALGLRAEVLFTGNLLERFQNYGLSHEVGCGVEPKS